MPKDEWTLPCPCGSSLRLGQCCGRELDQSMPFAWHEAHLIWPDTHGVLMAWAFTRFSKEQIAQAMARFARGEEPGLWPKDAWMPLVESWLVYDWMLDEAGRSLADDWLEQVAHGSAAESSPLVAMIRTANTSPLSVFQIERVEPGRGVELRDLLSDRTAFVHDRSLSSTCTRWSIGLARLLPHRDVTVLDAMTPFSLEPTWRTRLLDELEGWGEPLPWSEHELRLAGTDIFDLFDDAVDAELERLRSPQRMANTDGDPTVLCELRYGVEPQDFPTVLHDLVDLGWVSHEERDFDDPDQELPDDGKLTLHWHDVDRELIPGGGPVTIATIRLSSEALVLETNSRERRERVSLGMERELGPLVRRTSDSEKDMSIIAPWTPERGFLQPAEMMRELGGLDRAPEEEAKPEPTPPELEAAMKAALTDALEAAARAWPDESVPALGGLTPRAAIGTERGRRAVEDLLRSFEGDAHEGSRGAGMDPDVVRRELGLPTRR